MFIILLNQPEVFNYFVRSHRNLLNCDIVCEFSVKVYDISGN